MDIIPADKSVMLKGNNNMNENISSSLPEPHNKSNPVKRAAVFFEWIDRIVKVICMILFGSLAFVIFLQVFGRFFLPTPFSWTEELARYLMVWGAFIGASSMVKTWEHIYVDVFIEKLPRNLRKWFYLSIKTIILIFMVYITYIALKFMPPVGIYQMTPALQIPMLWAHLGMMIGFILIVVQLVGTVINDLCNGGK
jgi:TRAP-type C4-dicarboxylate transport system permease small subunit